MMKRGREEGECLMLLSKVGESETKNPIISKGGGEIDGDFKCKTCNRRFSSFQALGGHRASHKRPKMMVKDLGYLLQSPTMKQQPSRMKHPCPICGVEFGIGQALGGHMRKHRSTATINYGGRDSSDHHSFSIFENSKEGERLNLLFDLNLTPLDDDDLKLNLSTPLLGCFI